MKFLAQNIHTMDELNMIGNCLKGSRPILSLDAAFADPQHPELVLLGEMFSQMLGTPQGHRKSKPFIDHVLSLHVVDKKIWFRNYQIKENAEKKGEPELVEIGPQFTLTIVKMFAGSFGGQLLYQSPDYGMRFLRVCVFFMCGLYVYS